MTLTAPKTPKAGSGSINTDSPQSDSTEQTVASSTADVLSGKDLKRISSEGGSGDWDLLLDKTPEDINFKIPEDIKAKTYTSLEEFEKDLGTHRLQDCKYIALGLDGKAYNKMVAGPFHKTAVITMKSIVEEAVKDANFAVYIYLEPTIKVSGNHPGLIAYKEPDLALWGEGRMDDLLKLPETVTYPIGNKRRIGQKNPNVVIEFSWRNELADEIVKFNAQMTKCSDVGQLGAVQLGYLIKTIPLHKKKYPEEQDGVDEVQKKPIWGFDVYKAQAGEVVKESERHLIYRVGGDETGALQIKGRDLGVDGRADDVLINIPLSSIRKGLERRNLVLFQGVAEEDKEASDGGDESEAGEKKAEEDEDESDGVDQGEAVENEVDVDTFVAVGEEKDSASV